MKKTILVVDDYTSIREFVCETLERRGYNALGVSSGDEAVQWLHENPTDIDLIVSDYNMPGCSGFEMLKRIKSNPNVSSIPVIFLTSEASPDKMREARDAGLRAWIKKPYRVETFYAQIEMAFNEF